MDQVSVEDAVIDVVPSEEAVSIPGRSRPAKMLSVSCSHCLIAVMKFEISSGKAIKSFRMPSISDITLFPAVTEGELADDAVVRGTVWKVGVSTWRT